MEAQQEFMRQAIALSRQGMQHNHGGPFGAVIVKHGQVVGAGYNEVTSTMDPTAHAEIMAIRKASHLLGAYDLSGCEIYCSCEPCPMCLSAIYWARLSKIYIANTRKDAAAIGFDDALIYQEMSLPGSERKIPMQQLERESAQQVFVEWQLKADKIIY